MSILATRVGRLATPTAPGQTVCWRCGHTFNRPAENVIPGAPCRDCRDVLRAEGDETVWDSRRQHNHPKETAA